MLVIEVPTLVGENTVCRVVAFFLIRKLTPALPPVKTLNSTVYTPLKGAVYLYVVLLKFPEKSYPPPAKYTFSGSAKYEALLVGVKSPFNSTPHKAASGSKFVDTGLIAPL